MEGGSKWLHSNNNLVVSSLKMLQEKERLLERMKRLLADTQSDMTPTAALNGGQKKDQPLRFMCCRNDKCSSRWISKH